MPKAFKRTTFMDLSKTGKSTVSDDDDEVSEGRDAILYQKEDRSRETWLGIYRDVLVDVVQIQITNKDTHKNTLFRR